MTLTKAVPKGLKPQECEHGSSHSKLQILSIPDKDELQETIETTAFTVKLLLTHKLELQISICTNVTLEQFLMHAQQVISSIRQKVLKGAYRGH